MNLWTGEITKLITSQSEEGEISADISLSAGEATVIMVTEEEISAASEEIETKEVSAVLLKDSQWQLTVESYTAVSEDSAETLITEISQTLDGLAAWSEIEGLETVSGSAVYETTCQISSLDNIRCAELRLETGTGTMAVTGVIVNGQDAGVYGLLDAEIVMSE